MIEFRQVTEDDEAKLIVKGMMQEIGFGVDPSWYRGGNNFLLRTTAVNRLDDALQRRWKESDDVDHPHRQIIELLEDIARNEPDGSVYATYAAARLAIFGHVWLRKIRRVHTIDFLNQQAAALCRLIAQTSAHSGGGLRFPCRTDPDS